MSEAGVAREALPDDLYQNAACGLLSMSPEGKILEANETFAQWIGYSTTSLRGRVFPSLLDVGSRLFYETRQAQVVRLQGHAREVALTVVRADGSSMPILVNSVMHSESSGSSTIRVAVFDTTSRHEYERDLLSARRAAEASEARVRVLQDASSGFADATSEESLGDTLVAVASGALAATASTLSLLESDGSLRTISGVDPLLFHLGESDLRPEVAALADGDTVRIQNSRECHHEYPKLDAALRAAGLAAMISTALVHDSVPLGVLSSYFGRERSFDDETVELQRALARQASQAIVRIRLQRQLEQLARYDQLTGLANRNLLGEQLTRAIAAAERADQCVAVTFIDLDGFKAVNDGMGHSVGDSVLQQVSGRLRCAVRRNDTVGRFGGDEFVLVTEHADVDASAALATRIAAAIAEPMTGLPEGYPITASVGVVLCRPSSERRITSEELLVAADQVMYRSKQQGKNRATVDLYP